MSIKPVRPEDVLANQPWIPQWMIEGFNELIGQTCKDGRAEFSEYKLCRYLKRYDPRRELEVVTIEYLSNYTKQVLTDIPDLYRRSGWEVVTEVRKCWPGTDIRFWTFTKAN
mgnify:CR=1 FL=1